MIRGLEELLFRTAGPGIKVELNMEGGVWPVLCDPNQLEISLLNVAINAFDAMPEGGRPTISTRHTQVLKSEVGVGDEAEAGEYVEIAIGDTGFGMDEATQAHAFEPFFTTKPIGQGTGLGLSQLYGFVRQTGGFVRLESAPGQGTTVRLHLPRHTQVDSEAAAHLRQPEQAGPNGTLVLVEDEAGVRATAVGFLAELGYRVLEAKDGATALALLAGAGRVDLLVTDVGLPNGLNGRQVAEAARQERPGLPILFISGYAGSALAADPAPGMEVIGKPFTLDVFAARIAAMLEKRAQVPAL